MMLWLTHWLAFWCRGFDVFHYISLRGISSVLTSFLISLCLGPVIIRSLQNNQIAQIIRTDGPQSHLSKSGTPTMGGGLILLSVTLSSLFWGNLHNSYLWIVLSIMLLFGGIGWIDDFKKIREKSSRGLPAKWKYFWQTVFALIITVILYFMAKNAGHTCLLIPFLKKGAVEIGVLYIVLSYFVIVGASNAVNLTDGLDGLAIMPTILVGSALGVFAYLAGNHHFASYLHIPFIAGASELVIFTGAIAGSGLGFLWFNTYPAQVFMGDVGALALGAALGTVAVIIRQEIVLFIMGGIFVMETISVILQVASFKLTGKRIFKMAPLHHHFEIKGWPEPKIIVRFWIITLILVLIGFSSLKIR